MHNMKIDNNNNKNNSNFETSALPSIPTQFKLRMTVLSISQDYIYKKKVYININC